MRNRLITILAIVGLLSLGLATPSFAITNGGFETGDFSGWDTTGITSVITGSFAGGPTEGTSQAQLETGDDDPSAVSGADLETFLGLGAGSLDGLGNGTVISGSAIKQTFTANAGQVLSFNWNFLTSELTSGDPFNDSAFVTLISVNTLLNTLGSVASPLVPLPLGGDFTDQTKFKKFSSDPLAAGSYTLGLGVVNVGDNAFSSALLVDNVTLTPEPGTFLLLGSGLAGLTFWRRQQPA